MSGSDRVEDVLGSIRKLVADEAAQRRARWSEARLDDTLPAAQGLPRDDTPEADTPGGRHP